MEAVCDTHLRTLVCASTCRIPFQDAMENAMKESPDGTKWKENAILYDYTKESKPVSAISMHDML